MSKITSAIKQQVVTYFCPWSSVPEVENALRRIRFKSKEGSAVRSFSPVPFELKCDCGAELEQGKSCKECGRAPRLEVHQGKAYRDIRERGDLNTCAAKYDVLMSEQYNRTTVLTGGGKLKQLHQVRKDKHQTRDRLILEARHAFDEMSTRLHFKSTPPDAMNLFANFLSSVPRLMNKEIVHAACMFHTLKEPGKPWKKKLKGGKFNDSKKRRLKMMTFKKL